MLFLSNDTRFKKCTYVYDDLFWFYLFQRPRDIIYPTDLLCNHVLRCEILVQPHDNFDPYKLQQNEVIITNSIFRMIESETLDLLQSQHYKIN